MIELPALRANDHLGFLAAVGITALAEQEAIPPTQLSWTTQSVPIAVIAGPDYESLNDLAGRLKEAFQSLRQQNAAVIGPPVTFPTRKVGTKGRDPMRTDRATLRRHFENAAAEVDNAWFSQWVTAICAQTAPDSKGDVQLTPFYAPTGQMSLRNSIFDKTMTAVAAIGGPGDALTSWTRTSFDGANLDERAKRDAAHSTSGEADNQGAPSPTWLAAMAIRLFTITDTGSKAATVGWQPVQLYEGYTRRSLVWPIWTQPLEARAVAALLAHPALQLVTDGGLVRFADEAALPGLGVIAVYGSSRRTLSQGDGPLGPARRLWPK